METSFVAAQPATSTAMDSRALPARDRAYQVYQNQRKGYWDQLAKNDVPLRGPRKYYHERLAQVACQVVPPGQRVLEIGCGRGDLLAAVQPSYGVGIDFSLPMLLAARKAHPDLLFIQSDAHEFCLGSTTFDYILLSDLLNDAWDVQTIFESISRVCHPRTRILINTYSRIWELPLSLAERLGLARPVLNQNWLTVDDIRTLMRYSGLEVVRTWQEILLPVRLPLLTGAVNRYLARIQPFNHLCLSNFILARPVSGAMRAEKPSVSIIIPARNEAGNIERVFADPPKMEGETELVFVEGHSRDETYTEIERCMRAYPDVQASLYRQNGKGKGDAVRLGFSLAKGDILMILDADLTVPPHTLPRFYDAISAGKGEFINGVRLVYPMEKQAMQFLNLIGNKLFSLAFTWLLGQPVKDTLCGTKVLWREDYLQIAENRTYFGDFDPFGDFDLLFGAARLGLKIVDMPVRYRDRTYGSTNISRWKHGLLLLRMTLFGANRLKFI